MPSATRPPAAQKCGALFVPPVCICTACLQDNQRLEEEMMEIRQELTQCIDFIRSAFTYYAMTGGTMDSDSILQVRAPARPLLGFRLRL